MGKIIKDAPFKYRIDLEAMAPLSPEYEEIFRFMTEDPPADENALQRNYRLNRLKEFDEYVAELFGLDKLSKNNKNNNLWY